MYSRRPNYRDRRDEFVEVRSLKRLLGVVVVMLLLLTLPHSSISHTTTPPHFDGTDRSPVPAAISPVATLTYTSLWNSTETVVSDGDIIAGDHIVLHAKWAPSDDVQTSIIAINATVVPMVITKENDSAVVSIDTRLLGNNFTCDVNMTAILFNGSIITAFVYDVFLGNFFTPEVRVLSPNGGEVWTGVNNITWEASDKNVGEQLVFDVLVSSDAGKTMMLLASDLNRTWYAWNCSGFTKLDSYLIMVRVSDGIYTSSDTSDSVFTAGEIPPIPTTTDTTTSTTTTTPTTTTPTPPIEGLEMIPVFLLAVVISSGVMALFVYYSARRWI